MNLTLLFATLSHSKQPWNEKPQNLCNRNVQLQLSISASAAWHYNCMHYIKCENWKWKSFKRKPHSLGFVNVAATLWLCSGILVWGDRRHINCNMQYVFISLVSIMILASETNNCYQKFTSSRKFEFEEMFVFCFILYTSITHPLPAAPRSIQIDHLLFMFRSSLCVYPLNGYHWCHRSL